MRRALSTEVQAKAKSSYKLWLAGGLVAGAGVLGSALHAGRLQTYPEARDEVHCIYTIRSCSGACSCVGRGVGASAPAGRVRAPLCCFCTVDNQSRLAPRNASLTQPTRPDLRPPFTQTGDAGPAAAGGHTEAAESSSPAAELAARTRALLSRAAALITPSDAGAGAAKAKAAEILGRWSSDPESREALLAVGGSGLLDFLLDLACEDPSREQAAAEGVLCDLLDSRYCASRVLRRPGAVPRLLEHVASGKASERLPAALGAAAAGGADLDRDTTTTTSSSGGGLTAAESGLQLEDARALVRLLNSRHGHQVQLLAANFIEAWVRGGAASRRRLAAASLNPALAAAAMAAVERGGDGGAGALQLALCRVIRLMEFDADATTDADRAGWVRPVLFIAADAAASGDLQLADTAMQTIVHAARKGGPLVRSALRELHLMPTIEALASGSDPKLRVRAVAALAPLLDAGLIPSEADRAIWRDRLLHWLVDGSAGLATASGAGGSAPGSSAWAANASAGGDGSAAAGGAGTAAGARQRESKGWEALPVIGRWWRVANGEREKREDAGAAELRKACVSGLKGELLLTTQSVCL